MAIRRCRQICSIPTIVRDVRSAPHLLSSSSSMIPVAYWERGNKGSSEPEPLPSLAFARSLVDMGRANFQLLVTPAPDLPLEVSKRLPDDHGNEYKFFVGFCRELANQSNKWEPAAGPITHLDKMLSAYVPFHWIGEEVPLHLVALYREDGRPCSAREISRTLTSIIEDKPLEEISSSRGFWGFLRRVF